MAHMGYCASHVCRHVAVCEVPVAQSENNPRDSVSALSALLRHIGGTAAPLYKNISVMSKADALDAQYIEANQLT